MKIQGINLKPKQEINYIDVKARTSKGIKQKVQKEPPINE
jgi:hypothetical protein